MDDRRSQRRALLVCALCWVSVFVVSFAVFHNEVYSVLQLHEAAELHGHEDSVEEAHHHHHEGEGAAEHGGGVDVVTEAVRRQQPPSAHHEDGAEVVEDAATPAPINSEQEQHQHEGNDDANEQHGKKKKKAKKSHGGGKKKGPALAHDSSPLGDHEPPMSAADAAAPSNPRAVLHTSQGVMVWELFPSQAPESVALFEEHARGVYNGSCFYRYEKGFVLQGGLNCAKRPKGAKRSGKTVPLEYRIRNDKMTVALARAGGDLHSGGSEFFINLRNNTNSLGRKKKGGYAVFARVLEEQGTMATIAAMKLLPTHKSGLMYYDKPQPVIEHIEIIRAAAGAKEEGAGEE